MPQPRSCVSATASASLKAWATQRRRLLLGKSESVTCTIGRLLQGSGYNGGVPPERRQQWGEVYTGTAAVMQYQVFPTLPELPRLTVQFHYVLAEPWRTPIAAQARELGVGTREYWVLLHAAELAVDVALQIVERFQADTSRRLNGATRVNGAR